MTIACLEILQKKKHRGSILVEVDIFIHRRPGLPHLKVKLIKWDDVKRSFPCGYNEILCSMFPIG